MLFIGFSLALVWHTRAHAHALAADDTRVGALPFRSGSEQCLEFTDGSLVAQKGLEKRNERAHICHAERIFAVGQDIKLELGHWTTSSSIGVRDDGLKHKL